MKKLTIILAIAIFIAGCATAPKREVSPAIPGRGPFISEGIRYAMRTVVIDPGHGGKDPGTMSIRGIKEKNIVLNIAKRLKTYLYDEGIDVILTRDSDRFISLWRRAQIANE